MSYAITALVLLRLHKAPGEWIDVPELARYMAVWPVCVRHELECLAAAGDVQVRRDELDRICAARIDPGTRAHKDGAEGPPGALDGPRCTPDTSLPPAPPYASVDGPSIAPSGRRNPVEEPAR